MMEARWAGDPNGNAGLPWRNYVDADHPRVEHHTAVLPDVRLHYAAAGPIDGPLVVLLHGFPEAWFGWRRQVPALAAAGLRVVAPDQRGYNLSDKPVGLRPYRLDRLAGDVGALVDALGRERAAVVGHDWGGIVGWYLALQQPPWLERLAILNAPHPAVMARQLWRNPRQMRRSVYMAVFQLPGLPEHLARRRHWRLLEQALIDSSRPGTFAAAELGRYRAAWSRPGAFPAMLDWYRAALRHPPPRPVSSRVAVPTLLLWGVRDRFLGRELAGPSIDRCSDGRLVYLEEATHWLQHEEPERVNALLADFLQRRPPAP